ncbi:MULTISPECIES: hypothetical protein [Micromonospora]|uniref:hypothetical protein n=1 Tax=Micromonospora TaxID=1873 RepID=UPI001AE194B8|nr:MULTISPECIES: hypothetical protein [unclassified Micromonospora]MBP1781829.1 hypothetical protein [Micromonospora sp. HB375]
MIRTRHLAAVALVVALAGCGSTEEPSAAPTSKASTSSAPAFLSPSPSPFTSRPPADGGTYDSPPLLIEALAKGGTECTGYQAIANPTGALARGSCYVAGEEYTIGIYRSAAQARQHPNNMADLLEGVAEVNLVLGRNWTVGCPDQPSCLAVAALLGGEVFHQDV